MGRWIKETEKRNLSGKVNKGKEEREKEERREWWKERERKGRKGSREWYKERETEGKKLKSNVTLNVVQTFFSFGSITWYLVLVWSSFLRSLTTFLSFLCDTKKILLKFNS